MGSNKLYAFYALPPIVRLFHIGFHEYMCPQKVIKVIVEAVKVNIVKVVAILIAIVIAVQQVLILIVI